MSFYFLDYSHFIHCGIILSAVIGNYQACGKAFIYHLILYITRAKFHLLKIQPYVLNWDV